MKVNRGNHIKVKDGFTEYAKENVQYFIYECIYLDNLFFSSVSFKIPLIDVMHRFKCVFHYFLKQFWSNYHVIPTYYLGQVKSELAVGFKRVNILKIHEQAWTKRKKDETARRGPSRQTLMISTTAVEISTIKINKHFGKK